MQSFPEVHLPAGPQAATRALDFVASVCKAWQVNDDASFDISLAVDEGVSNIVNHGYDGAGDIALRMRREGRDVIIELEDQGRPYDPTNQPPPDLQQPLAEREVGGLGLWFMQKKMDAIDYQRRGSSNILTLTKKDALARRQTNAPSLAQVLDILLDASRALASTDLAEDAILDILQSQARRIIPDARIHILLFQDGRTQFFAWDETGGTQPPAWYDTPAAHSIMGWLKEARQPLLVRDFEKEWDQLPAHPSYQSQHPPRSAIFMPLLVANRALGVFSAQSQRPDAFNATHFKLLQVLANQAAAFLGTGRMLAAERRRANQLQTLAQVTRSVVSILDLDELVAHVVDIIAEAFDYYHVQLFVLQPESKRLLFKASSDRTIHQLWRRKGRYQSLHEGILGWVARNGRLRNAPDVTQDSLYIPDDMRLLPDTRSEIAVALKLEDEVLGVLDVQSDRRNAFGPEDEFILVALADAVALAIANARLYASAIEQQRLATELRLAREIQVGFLPDQLPALPGYEFAARWEPAREIGGDFYDFIPLQDGRLGLVIADVADKGVPAALYMALSRTTMRLVTAREPSPAVALQQVNTAILDTTYSDLFVTLFYLLIDPHKNRARYASGGHGLALLVRGDEIIPLRGKGMALGILPDIRIEEREQTLLAGDIIILYTDGVTDAVNEEMEEYGKERFYRRIRELKELPADEMAAGIQEDVRAWKGAAPRYDDFTLIIARRLAAPAVSPERISGGRIR